MSADFFEQRNYLFKKQRGYAYAQCRRNEHEYAARNDRRCVEHSALIKRADEQNGKCKAEQRIPGEGISREYLHDITDGHKKAAYY